MRAVARAGSRHGHRLVSFLAVGAAGLLSQDQMLFLQCLRSATVAVLVVV